MHTLNTSYVTLTGHIDLTVIKKKKIYCIYHNLADTATLHPHKGCQRHNIWIETRHKLHQSQKTKPDHRSYHVTLCFLLNNRAKQFSPKLSDNWSHRAMTLHLCSHLTLLTLPKSINKDGIFRPLRSCEGSGLPLPSIQNNRPRWRCAAMVMTVAL